MSNPHRTLSALGALALVWICGACSTSVGDLERAHGSSGGADSGGAGGTGASAAGGTGAWLNLSGSGGGGGSVGFTKVPVQSLPGLSSIVFFERTGGSMPTPYTFAVKGAELTERIPDPLGDSAFDIPGAPTEFYDVYYSDENGNFDLDGSYLTISGVFGMTSPWGGGLNLAEIALNFSGKPPEYGNYVASYAAFGDNKIESSVENCIDGNLQTETSMGNTVGATQRLRLTLGFESSSGDPPIK